MSRIYEALKRSEHERKRLTAEPSFTPADVVQREAAFFDSDAELHQRDLPPTATATMFEGDEEATQAEAAKPGNKNYELLLPPSGPERNADGGLSTIVPRFTAPGTNESSDFDVFALVRILLRRRLWIYVCTATMFAAAGLLYLFMTPLYIATSRLQLLNQEMGRLSLGDSSGGGLGFDFYSTLQTYVTTMQSDTLALQVINELDLVKSDDFRYFPALQTDEVRRELTAPLDQAPLKRAAILKKFRASLSIDSVPGTRLITVSYTDADPKLAAKIVNQLVSDFVEHNFQVRYTATTKATDFLARQLVDLKSEVEKSQQRAVELQKASGMVGADEDNNIITSRLEQLNNDLTQAQTNRVVKETVYNLARSGNPELIAGLLGNNGPGKGSGAANSLPLINHLRQQEADLNAEIADAASKYGPAYPQLIEMKERLTALQSSIKTELSKVLETARSEYELAASEEAAARKMFLEQKAIASKMNDQAIDYTIAKHEAESNRTLYDNLLQKLKEAEVLAGLRSSELNIIDPATVPGRPSKPRRLYLVLGALAGLLLGVIAAFLAEAADRTMRNPEEIEATTQIPVLGVIPEAKLLASSGSTDWLKAYGPGGSSYDSATPLMGGDMHAITEAFRWIRTSLLLSRSGEPRKVLMLASATPQEGKSFASLNVAAALAQNGNNVLLVDADLRRGTLSRTLKQNSGIGLTEILSGSLDRDAYRKVAEVPGLTFMPAGAPILSAAELLASGKMARMLQSWRAAFSYIVIDTPALLPVTDAAVLSSRVDGVIVVARFAFTHAESIGRAMRILRNLHAKCIGVLVNAVDVRSPEYSRHRGYGNYPYSQPELLASSSHASAGGESA